MPADTPPPVSSALASLSAPGRRVGRPVSVHWSVRLRDAVSTYLPLLLMLLLAGASWWLVRITPVPSALRPPEPSAQTPDYTLNGVDLIRYRADGTQMARLQGRELRHYPVGDRLELDEARIQADHPDGALSATAERAQVTEGGNRIRLMGAVVLQRRAEGPGPAFEVRGREIELDMTTGQAWSKQPVQWLQDGVQLQAAGFDYRQSPGEVRLTGPVRSVWSPAGAGRR